MALPLRWTLTFAALLGCAPTVACRGTLTPAGPEDARAQAPKGSGEKAKGPAAVAKAVPPAAIKHTEATTLYAQRCALCHGAHGKGDGIAAVNLRPGPRSFASAEWQAQTSDAAIAEIIVKGGKAVGRSMMMPPAKDLEGQEALLLGLVAVVRNFGPGGAKAVPAP